MSRDGASRITKARSFLTNAVTKRNGEAQALRESGQRYRALFDRSLDAVYIHDFEGKFLDANGAALRMLGYSRDEILELSFADLLDESQLPSAAATLQEIITTGAQAEMTVFQLRRKDGRIVEVETLASVITEDGQPFAIQGIARDITERRRADAALRAANEELESRVAERTAELEQKNAKLLREIAERGRAKEAQRQSEERFRRVFNDGPLAMVIVGRDFRPVELNARFCDMLGYTRDELMSLAREDFLHPEDATLDDELVKQLVAGEIPWYQIERRYIKKSGETIWVRFWASLIRDAGRADYYGLGMMEDITDRKQIEETLLSSEDRFRNIFEAAFEGIVVHDHGTVLDVNPAFEKTFGYAASESVGKRIPDFVAPESLELTLEKLSQPPGEPVEIVGMRKDGTTFRMEVAAREHVLNGRTVRVAAVRDISERKRLEEALRLHSEIMQNMAEAVYLIRASDGIIVYTNPAFERLFGYGAGDMIGKPVSIVNAPNGNSPEDVANEVMAALERTGVWSGEILNIRKDGTSFWCYANVSTFIHDEHGEVWVAYHSDITERKRAEDALRASTVLLERTFASLNEVVLVVDPASRTIIACNPAAERVFGYSEKEMLGRNTEFLHVDRAMYEEFGRKLYPALDAHGILHTEYQARRKDGTVLVTDHTVTEIVEDSGRRTGLVSVIRDISERKRLEEQLRQAREELEGKVERQMLRKNPYSLTFRELTVLHLVAAGRSNKEIAAELVVSPQTVHRHVANILAKMDVSSRTAAATRALREGLLE